MFKREFNDERPHEALGMKPPAKFYASSPRSYPSKVVDPEYPNGHLLRRVSAIGVISWEGQRVFLSSVLAGQVIALQQVTDAVWHLRFGPLLLGALDARKPELGVVPVRDDDESHDDDA